MWAEVTSTHDGPRQLLQPLGVDSISYLAIFWPLLDVSINHLITVPAVSTTVAFTFLSKILTCVRKPDLNGSWIHENGWNRTQILASSVKCVNKRPRHGKRQAPCLPPIHFFGIDVLHSTQHHNCSAILLLRCEPILLMITNYTPLPWNFTRFVQTLCLTVWVKLYWFFHLLRGTDSFFQVCDSLC